MKITVPMEKLRERSLFVATPMYGGQCTGSFAKSTADLAVFCATNGIRLKLHYIYNESLITRARNYCVDEFIRSDYTHLLFIDADIAFNPRDAIALLALQDHEDPENPYDILAAPYPKKSISWEKIKHAVDKGFADKDPQELANFVGDYVFNPVGGGKSIKIGEPQEVLETGTGFMMIRRRTFDNFAKAYPQQLYRPDHHRSKHFNGDRQIMAYFDTPICPETNRYLSEDYMFCQWSRKIGMKVWICPWIPLAHIGTYIFSGSLAELAKIGASATIDEKTVANIRGKK